MTWLAGPGSSPVMTGWACPVALLSDDRPGRALDAISARLDEIAGAVALAAGANFGVDAARLHWDFTSVAFCGAYADQDDRGPRVGFGHFSDRRGHRRQLKVAHATTPGGIALYGRVTHGSRHEGADTYTLLEQLRRRPPPAGCCWWPTRRWSARTTWPPPTRPGCASCPVCPAASTTSRPPWTYPPRCGGRCPIHRRFLVGSPKTADPPSGGAEHGIEITGPDKTLRQFRVLYIYGSEEADAARASRSRLLERAETALARIRRGLDSRPRQNPEGVERRVAKAVAAGRVGQLLRTQVHTDADGTVSVKWWPDQAAIAAAQQRDGLYALITNMDADAARPTGSWPSTNTRPNPSQPTTSSKDPSPCAPCS